MATLAKITLWLAIVTLYFGQLSKFSFDIAVCLAAIFNILFLLSRRKLKIHNRWFFLFLVYSWLVLLFIEFTTHWYLTPLFYLIRLTALLTFFIFPPTITPVTRKLLLTVLLATVVFGLLQYVIWPNFTYFSTLDWDPHLNRIVGTFFDPTFTALVFLLLLITLYFQKNYLLLIPTYLALALTYSRASWLSLAVAAAFTSFNIKKKSLFIGTLILLGITITLLPKPYGEGTRLGRTSTILAKVENYRIALETIKTAPIFGYGYNRLSLIRTDQPTYSHSISGFDNSLLTIWATTGIIGLFFFISAWILHLKTHSWQYRVFFWAVLVHSFFANSLLYAPILFLLAVF
ncbi:O-antigen ligase family protein [Patescibacteria group bacterium]|nr:O-antigen ligase family protein [Patescibacteria group bacterium]